MVLVLYAPLPFPIDFKKIKNKKNNPNDKIENERKEIRSIWYICLKTENCYLKIFIKTRMNKKVCKNTYNTI